MTCERCNRKMPGLPETAVWGPPLWAMLHGLAQRSDKIVTPHTMLYAARQWIRLLEALPMTLPCPVCQSHAQEWLLSHPVQLLLKQTDIKSWLVTWLYDFHESVNARRGVPSFNKELLEETYKDLPLREIYEACKTILASAKEGRATGFLKWKQCIGTMLMLLAVHGV